MIMLMLLKQFWYGEQRNSSCQRFIKAEFGVAYWVLRRCVWCLSPLIVPNMFPSHLSRGLAIVAQEVVDKVISVKSVDSSVGKHATYTTLHFTFGYFVCSFLTLLTVVLDPQAAIRGAIYWPPLNSRFRGGNYISQLVSETGRGSTKTSTIKQ